MLHLTHSDIPALAVAARPRRPRARAWAAAALLAALLLPLAATVAAAGGFVFLVADINTAAAHTGSAFGATAPPANPRTAPDTTAVITGTVYFAANDGTHGNELWKSIGGAASTLVLDINPGAGDSNPSNLTVVGGLLYFSASDGTHGNELWQSDGTALGTTRLTDINASGDSNIGNLTALGTRLFFTANAGVGGA